MLPAAPDSQADGDTCSFTCSHPAPESNRVVKGIAAVALFLIAAKGVGTVKEAVVAYRYGVTPVLDGYLFVFNTVMWWTNICAAASGVIVALLTRARYTSHDAYVQFRRELIGMTVILVLLSSLSMSLGLGYCLQNNLPGLSPQALEAAEHSVLWLVASMPLTIFAFLFSSFLMVREQHVNTLLESLPAAGIILFLAVSPSEGIMPILSGTVLGTLLFFILVLLVDVRMHGFTPPHFRITSEQWRPFLRGYGVVAAGLVITNTVTLIDNWFAAQLGEGAIATLGYGNRLMSLLLGIVGTVVMRALLPVMSSIYVQQGEDTSLYVVRKWLKYSLTIGTILVLITVPLLPYVVEFILQRGAFTEQDAAAVSTLLRVLVLQVPFYGFSILLSQWIISWATGYRLLLNASVIGAIIKVTVNIVAVSGLGLSGIALSTVCMYASMSVYLLIRSRVIGRRVNHIDAAT
jgi:putative peptidoglycan lipid II flippase